MDTWIKDNDGSVNDWDKEKYLKELYPDLNYDDARERYRDEHISGPMNYFERYPDASMVDYYRATGIKDPWELDCNPWDF